tara:strand:+ start:453 stop:731 length:279 start_codon:yes stop_codon:yes gene_type:complete
MQGSANPGIMNLVPVFFIFIVFYFFIIRPQKKKQEEHQTMVANLKKNDEVITSGGIHGTVVAVKDKTFTVRIDEATKIEIDKIAIAQIKKAR